ncbi:flagellar export chaperone FliS [Cohnella pontilimi]|uniref:Flagellar secretion chaperone FliS n=1 Tax=Cohnella pontilimi TaxID=2564100 RepID=A0A4U0FB07_9BACL|nr:flagellar export chaperone FliS [Cohnella pontilimi]TJY41955.1 flagellar export chaperone FliS [Cohnella pontilimi]
MIYSPLQKYQQSSVQTASPAQLVLMLYEGAIRFVKHAIDGIDNRDIEKANTNFIKAQRIINELTASLDYQYPISTDLARIYEYMTHQLIQANTKKSKQPAVEVLSYLMELKEAWSQAAKPQPQTQTVSKETGHG